jgi:hypothetical protein
MGITQLKKGIKSQNWYRESRLGMDSESVMKISTLSVNELATQNVRIVHKKSV